ncbi:hypothetical protein [Methanosarcina mazei]|uniref:Guanylate cyclase domain-containing protein n=1 Tax=Methanosarcina mazei TaxID=2209 RepID=A0A0F8GGS3_METMZ|nr:hypothetical protein [Methanosarcina mazei]KKG64482.1 hypothetical protein DU67_07390 [Methanosarcina mazei]
MPIENYDGDTFVAFVDISGFKYYMKNEPQRALEAVSQFYQNGFDALEDQENVNKVEGIFVSDCCILFVRKTDICESLINILNVVKKINRKMIVYNFMLTTSITYGKFSYQDRIEYPGITKNPIISNAYISAYQDTESAKPLKLKPGQCRIVIENLPSKIKNKIEKSSDTKGNDTKSNDTILQMVRKKKRDHSHYYFYWSLNNPDFIDKFEREYNGTYKRHIKKSKDYDKLTEVLKKLIHVNRL